MKTYLTFLSIISIFIISCSITKDKNSYILDSATETNPLGILYQTDSLTLTAKFSECGEFGGHKEKMTFYCNYKREYFVRFTKDSIDENCPNDFEENAVVVKDTLFKINDQQQKLVINYLDKLYMRSKSPKPPYHAADYFEAFTRGRKFSLYTFENPKKWKEFNKLQLALTK